MLVPTNTFPGLECLGDLRLVAPQRLNDVAEPGHEDRAALVGEDHGLLGRQGESLAVRVHFDVARCGLRSQPLADVAFRRSRALSEFRRGQPGDRKLLVESETVADQHQRGGHGGAHIANHFPHEFIEFGFVERHVGLPAGRP